VKDLRKAAQKSQIKLDANRQGWKFGIKALGDNDKTLTSYGVDNGAKLELKDYGPQVGYRTVFVVEYAGPLFIVLLYALRPSFLYNSADVAKHPYTLAQKLGIACWTFHFAKREFETFFVHKFSRPTMPLFNIVKNSMYYWSFGALCGYFLCHPLYTPPSCDSCLYIGLVWFILSEIGNFIVHWQLSRLRPKEGTTMRPIPTGLGFKYVSCPNYTFEVSSWIGYSIMTSMLYSWAFTAVGFLQMLQWAMGKHRNYIKEYGADYKKLNRKAMIPFVM